MSYSDILIKLQEAILSELEDPPKSFLQEIKEPLFNSKEELFKIYYNGYRKRLAEMVFNDFPVLRNYLGDKCFSALVEHYINAKPSKEYNARWYSSGLIQFMQENTPLIKYDRSIDLAKFEKELADCFDANDMTISNISILEKINQNKWPDLRFKFHPSVSLRIFIAGTARIFENGGGIESITSSKEEGFEHILFWRKNNECFYRITSELEYLILIDILKGVKFKDACSNAAFQKHTNNIENIIAEFLLNWFNDCLITELIFE